MFYEKSDLTLQITIVCYILTGDESSGITDLPCQVRRSVDFTSNPYDECM